MRFLLFLFFFFSIPSTIVAQCLDGDFYHDGFCYMVPFFDGKDGMTHNDAQKYCSKFGAHLPVFHNSEQEGFVTLMAIRTFGKGVNWIGLNHPGKWDDGSNVDYVNWGSGCPTNKSHCVMEYFNHKNSNDGNWRDDYNCSHVAKFFCQYPTKHDACANTDFQLGSRCFTFSDDNDLSTYDEAKTKCAQKTQTLAVFDTMADVVEVGELAFHMYPRESAYWIGLRRDDANSPFKWADDTPLTYTNWNPGNPKSQYNHVSQDVYYYNWTSVASSTKLPYICSGTSNDYDYTVTL